MIEFILFYKFFLDLKQTGGRKNEIFQNSFNLKLFRQQLAYYKDIDYTEVVAFIGENPDDREITQFLTNAATESF